MSLMVNQQKPINNEEDEDFSFAMQLAEMAVLPMVMQVAIELNVFEIIAQAGPGAQLSPKIIASRLLVTTNNPEAENMLDRILRVLASYSVLTSSLVTNENGLVERLYGLASVCKYFVQNADGVSLAPYLVLAQDKVFMDSWFHLKDTVIEGGNAFSRAHGMHAFEYPEVDQRFNQVFNRGMFNHTTIFMKKVLETYKGFDDLKEVVDVGGGIGTIISLITSKYPTIKGINFDLPHVIAQAPSYPGVEHIGGNMFDSVPTGEVIFMKWILHDWSDKKCLEVLKNIYKALPDKGKLIVVEVILPVAAETSTVAKGLFQMDVSMMTLNPGGKERTEEEFHSLAKEAGFARMEKVCCIYNYWIMEFYKI